MNDHVVLFVEASFGRLYNVCLPILETTVPKRQLQTAELKLPILESKTRPESPLDCGSRRYLAPGCTRGVLNAHSGAAGGCRVCPR